MIILGILTIHTALLLIAAVVCLWIVNMCVWLWWNSRADRKRDRDTKKLNEALAKEARDHPLPPRPPKRYI